MKARPTGNGRRSPRDAANSGMVVGMEARVSGGKSSMTEMYEFVQQMGLEWKREGVGLAVGL